MFGLMFRMMLTMMNVMSGAMLNNGNWGNNGGNNNWLNRFGNGLGGFNSFNLGMQALPMMSGIGSPWNSFGGSPWSSWGNPWSSTWGAPWSAWGKPWGSAWNNPWSRGWGNPWRNGRGMPYGGGYPGYSPGGYGFPISYGTSPPGGGYGGHALLDGRWYGNNGEILQIRGNRFQLQDGANGLKGMIRINDNLVDMYSPQTNTTTSYTFVRNQTGLLLQDANGNVLSFTQNPAYGGVRIF